MEQLCADQLPFFLTNKLNPEIGLEGDFLWDIDIKHVEQVAQSLISNNLFCTLHAPFQDLVPGGFDTRFIDLTRKKLHKAFSLIPILKPKKIVCHLGYNPMKHSLKFKQWLDISTQTWSQLLPIAAEHNVQVMFENTYESTPEIHKAFFGQLESFHPGFCLDTGHIIAFSKTSWQKWVEEMFPWLGHLHLHDNDGSKDSHNPVGYGVFDFAGLFNELELRNKNVSCTLEQRTPEDMYQSLKAIHSLKNSFIS